MLRFEKDCNDVILAYRGEDELFGIVFPLKGDESGYRVNVPQYVERQPCFAYQHEATTYMQMVHDRLAPNLD